MQIKNRWFELSFKVVPRQERAYRVEVKKGDRNWYEVENQVYRARSLFEARALAVKAMQEWASGVGVDDRFEAQVIDPISGKLFIWLYGEYQFVIEERAV